MTIYSGVFPSCQDPSKSQMEACFQSLERKLITTEVIRDFQLTDEPSGWRIGISLDKARRIFPKFYDSLSPGDKLFFQLSFLNSGVQYLQEIVENINKVDGHETVSADLLEQFRKDLFAKISPLMFENHSGSC